MSNLFTERVLNMAAVTPQPEDYTGEDGLLYCGKCHTPKEAYFPEKQAALFGRDRHPAESDASKPTTPPPSPSEKAIWNTCSIPTISSSPMSAPPNGGSRWPISP